MKKVENLFQRAVMGKYRFPYKGSIATEDLYDLNINSLNEIYKTLKSFKKEDEDSLLNIESDEDIELNDKLKIVKEVFDYKNELKEEAKVARENKAKKQKLLNILSDKEDEDLKNKSIDELKSMIESL